VYLQPGSVSGSQLFRGVIYADAGGAPGALLGLSSELTFVNPGGAGWYDLPFSSPVALQPGSYWIGIVSGGSSYVAAFRYASVSGSRVYNADSYADGVSDPFGAGSTDSEQMSLYASYATSS